MAEFPEPEASSEEAAAEQLEEQLRRLKVSDLLLQTLYTLSSLGYGKLSPESRDLPEARVAIEALRALLPVLRDSSPPETVRDLEQVLANLQLAYASAAAAESPPPSEPDEPPAM